MRAYDHEAMVQTINRLQLQIDRLSITVGGIVGALDAQGMLSARTKLTLMEFMRYDDARMMQAREEASKLDTDKFMASVKAEVSEEEGR